MSIPFRGIVEGFYGRPWSHEERVSVFDFMQNHGLNGYIYGPKDDALHRDRWQAPYTDDALTRFRELIHAARAREIRFTFALSPGLDLCYSDENDFQALVNKLDQLRDLGVASLGIFFDDVPPDLTHERDRATYVGLGEAQADILTRLHAHVEDSCHLVTVPTFYCGEPDTPYLHALATTPAAVDIMWTGPAICSQHLTREHLQQVADVLRRPALIWDNYPVNDAAMIAELHIGPYRNRETDLPVRGIYVNPMSLPAASRLALITFAEYCDDPAGYDPDRSWAGAAVAEVGEELVHALGVFADAVTISPLTPEEPPAMEALVAPFRANLLPYIHNPAPDHLRAGLAEMRTAHRALMGSIGAVPLLAEIEPWLRDYGRWIDLMEAALRYVDARYAGDETERAATMALARADIRRGLKEAVDLRTATCGDVLRCFLQELLRRTGEPLVPDEA